MSGKAELPDWAERLPEAPAERDPGAKAQAMLEIRQAAADSDQAHSDADQAGADADQAGADADQAGSDADQEAADSDQAAADRDRDHAHGLADVVSDRAYEASRAERIGAAAGRTDVSAGRDASTATRASIARARTRGAARRDEAAFEDEVRRRTALQVERHRALLAEAEELAGAGTWEHDLRTGSWMWSPGMYHIRGREPGARPTTLADATRDVHPDDRERVRVEYTHADPADDDLHSTHRIVRPDGAVRHLETRSRVERDVDGEALRILGVSVDATERHAVQLAKDEFTSIVSHELRTPLTSIRGSLGLLESGVLGPLPEAGQRMIEIAVANIDRLVRLVNDILDIERINAGEIDMLAVSCDARELIARAIEATESIAAAASVTVVSDDAQPVGISADPDRLIQTLTNLISNALKFSTAGGSVRVTCAAVDGEALFEVSDQGRGIPAEHLESIFERFRQVDASDSREKGGTGLGLAICRTIVEQHGGRIWAQSTPGKGTTLSFTLPTTDHDDTTARRPESPEGTNVLV